MVIVPKLFVLLTKKEGNVIASGYRNAMGYGYVSLFDLRFTWLFSEITQTYIVKHNGFFFSNLRVIF